MDPVTIAMLGGTALSSILGNSAQKKQLKLQKEQLAFEKEIQREQLELQRELQRRGIATQIDQNGNVTRYDEATNTWQTILSPTQQRLQNLSDQEQINQLTTDAPMSRLENILNATRRSKEGTVADGVLSTLTDRLSSGVRGSDLASSLRLSRRAAVDEGFDQVSRSIGTQALRSGAAGGGAIAAALAKQRSQAIAQAMGNPDIEGMQLAEGINASRIGNTGNLYQALASRASGGGGGTFNPVQVGNPNGIGMGMNAAASGSGQAGNLLTQTLAGVRNQTMPNYVGASLAPTVSALTQLLGTEQFSQFLKPRAPRMQESGWSDSWGGGS